jgi:hypothetical protein
MYYDPHTHLTIARDRHEDMLREARKAQLARSVEDKHQRLGIVARLRGLRRERVQHEPAVRPV